MKRVAAILILLAVASQAEAHEQNRRPVYYGTNGGNLNGNYNGYNNNWIAPAIAGAVVGAIVAQAIRPSCYTRPVTTYVQDQWGQMAPVTQMQTFCN
jgi:outer membrane lipoprotein SlyB